MLHPDKTKIQLKFTQQIKTFSWNLTKKAGLDVLEILKNIFLGKPERKCSFGMLHYAHVCKYV